MNKAEREHSIVAINYGNRIIDKDFDTIKLYEKSNIFRDIVF